MGRLRRSRRDQASIFRIAGSARDTGGLTQFGRALSELNIDIVLRESGNKIHA